MLINNFLGNPPSWLRYLLCGADKEGGIFDSVLANVPRFPLAGMAPIEINNCLFSQASREGKIILWRSEKVYSLIAASATLFEENQAATPYGIFLVYFNDLFLPQDSHVLVANLQLLFDAYSNSSVEVSCKIRSDLERIIGGQIVESSTTAMPMITGVFLAFEPKQRQIRPEGIELA